jgi:hypothetical protein
LKFQFTPEQIENLKKYKFSLSSDKAKKWFLEEEMAELEISTIFNNEKFIQGENLSAQKVDEVFRLMKKFSKNRNLSNLLYKTNLDEFNNKLRNLIHGTNAFPERVNEFFKLHSIGIQTLSQLLVSSDTKNYPFVTMQTKEVLEISSEQDQAARTDAIEFFQIKYPENFLERTLEYLRDYIIFKSIKELLNLEKYTQINNLLWFSRIEYENDPDDNVKSYSSISMENDLRDFLADNIFLVEKGLSLIEKEFDAKVGGRIDLLCKEQNGNHVIIELKKGRKNDEVVGQTLRYLGWVEKNLKSKARGIIIVNEPDERLEYALSPLNNLIQLKYYRVSFEVKDNPYYN